MRDLDRAARRALDLDAAVDDVEIFGRGLELIGRDLEQLPSRFARSLQDRASDAVNHLASTGCRTERCARCVSNLDANLLRFDTKSLRGDHGQPCPGAADIGRPDENGQGAVRLDSAACRRRCASAAPGAQRDPNRFAVGGRRRVQRVAPGFLEHFDCSDARPLVSVRRWIALTRNIAQAQLDGIDVQPRRELVHRRLEGEARLRRARGPIRVDRGLVGRHLVATNVEVREAVCAAEEVGGQSGVPARGRAVVVVEART